MVFIPCYLSNTVTPNKIDKVHGPGGYHLKMLVSWSSLEPTFAEPMVFNKNAICQLTLNKTHNSTISKDHALS